MWCTEFIIEHLFYLCVEFISIIIGLVSQYLVTEAGSTRI